MKINANVIMEIEYIVEVDVPYEKEDKLFEEISCEPCMGDILDVEIFLIKRGLRCKAKEGKTNYRIETWR